MHKAVQDFTAEMIHEKYKAAYGSNIQGCCPLIADEIQQAVGGEVVAGELTWYGGSCRRTHWWGHKAEKATWLYVVGCDPEDIPPIRLRTTRPTHVVSTGHGLREGDAGFRSRVTDAEREHTPPALAAWLVELAAKCKTRNV